MAKSSIPPPSKGFKRETQDQKKRRSAKVYRKLRGEFPEAATALHHENAFQLLIATILSAQCTDERVNAVTKGLFKKYRSPKAFAEANQAELESDIRSTGFFRMKTKSIIACSRDLIARHGGRVPADMESLVVLAGVGRKTANVVLGQAFGIGSGVVVDTHVHRVARRLGLTAADSPESIEADLMALFPQNQWIDLGSMLILHGRKTCNARKPLCAGCPLNDQCPSAEYFLSGNSA